MSGIVRDFPRVLRFTFPVRVVELDLRASLESFVTEYGRASQLLIDFIFRSSNIFLRYFFFVFVVVLSICTCPTLDVYRFRFSHTSHRTWCTLVSFAAVIRVVTQRSSPLGRSVA